MRATATGLTVYSVRALGANRRSLKLFFMGAVRQRSLNRGLGLDVETTKVSDFFALLKATYILDLAYRVDVNRVLSQAISIAWSHSRPFAL